MFNLIQRYNFNFFNEMKTIYKATKQDINMPVDKQLQRTILKYFCWGYPQLLFWGILLINFLFYVIRGS